MKNKNIYLVLAMILGTIFGMLFKEASIFIKPLGTLFITLMFEIVVPLVFFTITSSIMKMKKNHQFGKVMKKTVLYFVITSLIATLFMLAVVIFINPVGKFDIIENAVKLEKLNFLEQVVNAVTVTDFYLLFSKSHMLALIIFAITFGFLSNDEKFNKAFSNISDILMKLVNIIMIYAPIGIFAYFANIIVDYGAEIIGSYAKTMILFYIVSIIYFVIVYTIYAYRYNKVYGIKLFYKNITPSFICSLGTCSSLASLPTNLKTAENMGIDNNVKDIVLPLGATVHMEGSCMSSILKIFFLFTIFNIPFSIFSIVVAVIISILSGVVMSGIPGGGLIGEMLIVSLYGLPSSAFAIISTIGWLVDPPATMLNVTGDISTALLINKDLNKV
ncbi:MAG: dicarboxylate/amino acid:cation symporter [Bacilli bacterium]